MTSSPWWCSRSPGRFKPVPDAPRLSAASCDSLREIVIVDEHGDHRQIQVPVERPLTVFLDDRELVTLMTLGASPELLVLGYLRNQRVVSDVAAIESITVDWKSGAAAVKTRSGAHDIEVGGVRRIVSTGCGLGTVFGELMTQVDGDHPSADSGGAHLFNAHC